MLIIYIILSILLFDPKLFTGGDNAVYVILAKSIISGKGYRNIERPEEPLHTQYPPGFPLLLSIFILVFGENIIILKFLILLIGSGALFFMTKIIQIIFKDHAKIVVLFYLSIPIFIIYNHWLLSEIPFLFFSLGALYFSLKNSAKNNSLYFIIS
ncbi:MAG: glycosyltransferase family 39 protein, partial [candidate division WOR-3 bacterium]